MSALSYPELVKCHRTNKPNSIVIRNNSNVLSVFVFVLFFFVPSIVLGFFLFICWGLGSFKSACI